MESEVVYICGKHAKNEYVAGKQFEVQNEEKRKRKERSKNMKINVLFGRMDEMLADS